MKIKGYVHKYGSDVNTDVIIPARYLTLPSVQEMKAHCMEDIDPAFAGKVRLGDIIVAGRNFGSGSSREHAAIVIKAHGISCIIAESFSRIFYRNAINIGLPVLTCRRAAEKAVEEDLLDVNLAGGIITNLSRDETYTAESIPDFVIEMIQCGGLINAVRIRLREEKSEESS